MKVNENLKRIEAARLTKNATEIKNNSITMTPPSELTSKNVIYWSNHWKKLVVSGGNEGSVIGQKARMFIEQKCIEYIKDEYISSNSKYICKPLKGNHTTHSLKWNKGDFECDCQYFQTKLRKGEKPFCSHYLALYLQLKIWNWKKKDLNVGITSI